MFGTEEFLAVQRQGSLNINLCVPLSTFIGSLMFMPVVMN
jgi:hypothetical protein